MARCLKLIRELPEWKGFAELYRRDDKYIVVSTAIVDFGGDPVLGIYNTLSGVASDVGMLDYPVAEIGDEETQAIESDSDGNVSDDWPIITVAIGEGSREKVMTKLREEGNEA